VEGLTEIPEKMSRAEFEERYARALSRLREHEKRTALKKTKAIDKNAKRVYPKIGSKI